MYELKKKGDRYLTVNLLGPGPRLKKNNLPGCGLAKVEKHWYKLYGSVSQTVVRGPQVVLGFCPCGPFRLNISPKKTEKIKLT